MNENIKALLEKLSKDEGALAKLQAVKSADEAYELVSAIQGGFTKEEFVETMEKLKAAGEGELSDDEVSAAAGGMNSIVESTIVTTSHIVAAAASY